jgi:NTP pyrophosphatase (non-canonical NTP hydrolase)|tara:strand:- start:67 stop:399 length:333 start_codon:yes stop_codon:yes gene_type:complete
VSKLDLAIDEYILRIEEWGIDRGLISVSSNENSKAQMLKLMEEVGETARALAYGDQEGLIDGIGDCVVVLTILAQQCDTSLAECIDAAWDEIKDRKGRLEDGLFKKDSDL